jgi:predicted component of type VI protein secretion system
MGVITLQVLDGVDRGKIFRDRPTPITLGREEGNVVQLNDERISRYHAKIQEDQGQIVLTDLDSTNGTRVNGEPVQLSILRIGDRIALGRSVLLFGSPEQIDASMRPAAPSGTLMGQVSDQPPVMGLDKTRPISGPTGQCAAGAADADELFFELKSPHGENAPPNQSLLNTGEGAGAGSPPELPVRLSPAQAAQLAELLRHLHQALAAATDEAAQGAEDGGARFAKAAWHRILRVQMDLATYLRRIGYPDPE